MGDPLSAAASVAGLLSLGVQVSQSLVTYYTAYRDQNSHVARTASKLEALLETFESLRKALRSRCVVAGEQALIAKVQSSIENCHDLILELQQEIEKFSAPPKTAHRPTIKTASRRMAYPFRQSTLQKLDEDISDIRENLSLALDVLHLNDDQNVQEDLRDIKSVLELVRASQVTQEVREWLQAPDPFINYNDACAKRHTASGLWFVTSSSFTEWLRKDGSFLWLNGFAGCGKSVLASTAILYTLRHRQSNPHIGIAFFYFSFNDSSKQDIPGLLRAVLLQLSNQSKDTQIMLTHLYKSYKNGEPPIPVLLECVQQAVQTFQDVYLIVDALDESPRPDARERVLKAFADFRRWSLRGFHILVTSRDEPDIRDNLRPLSTDNISMKNTGVDQDIKDFIRGYLEQDLAMQKWSRHHPRIEEVLTAKADGVFRWVECQFRSLRSCPRSEDHLEKLLNALPQSLDETYERMLFNIDTASADYARRILMWLCFSKRPLTVPELIDGIAVELDDHAGLNRKRRLYDRNDLLQICPGFISVAEKESRDKNDRPSYIVSIAHYSVQEFLESGRLLKQGVAFFSMRASASDVEIAETCLVYLLDPSLSNTKATHGIVNELPLLEYAASYWYRHIKGDRPFPPRLHSFVMSLFASRNYTLRNCIAIHDPDRPWLWPFDQNLNQVATPIYYSSLLGLHSVLCALLGIRDQTHLVRCENSTLENGADVNAPGGEYGSALHAASVKGYEEIVKLLLDKGADVNYQGGLHGSALHLASERGYEGIIKLLLDKGADVNVQGGLFGSVLQAASFGKHEGIVKLVLDKGADVNALGGKDGSALHAASVKGYEEIVKLLLNKGADVNAQDGYYGSALQAASFEEHEGIVKLLLDKGADVNAPSGIYDSALQAASFKGHENIAKLLLDKGADVNTRCGYSGNALQAASIKGHEGIIKLLLDKGADVNVKGGKYNSALYAASEGGHEGIIKLLLDKGADVNVQGGYFGSVLQAASFGKHEGIVKLVLDKGADVNAHSNREYGTALHSASFKGHEGIAKLLLDKGADVNAEGGKYCNALYAASEKGHENMAKLLLDRGADVNVQTGHSGNPLQAASFSGHEGIAKLLLDKGADVNAQTGYFGSALQAASFRGHEGIAKLLLDKGADVNAQVGYPGTALHAASIQGHRGIIKLLLDKGADVNANALQAASELGHEGISELLLDKGADVNAEG